MKKRIIFLLFAYFVASLTVNSMAAVPGIDTTLETTAMPQDTHLGSKPHHASETRSKMLELEKDMGATPITGQGGKEKAGIADSMADGGDVKYDKFYDSSSFRESQAPSDTVGFVERLSNMYFSWCIVEWFKNIVGDPVHALRVKTLNQFVKAIKYMHVAGDKAADMVIGLPALYPIHTIIGGLSIGIIYYIYSNMPEQNTNDVFMGKLLYLYGEDYVPVGENMEPGSQRCKVKFAYLKMDDEFNASSDIVDDNHFKLLGSSIGECIKIFENAPVILRSAVLVDENKKRYKFSSHSKKINVLSQYQRESNNSDSFQSTNVKSKFNGIRARLCGVTDGELSRISLSDNNKMHKSINKGHYFETTKSCSNIFNDIQAGTVEENTLSKVLVSTKKDDVRVVVFLDPLVASKNNQCTVKLLSADDSNLEQVIIGDSGDIHVFPGIYSINCNCHKPFSVLFEVNELGAKNADMLNSTLREKYHHSQSQDHSAEK